MSGEILNHLPEDVWWHDNARRGFVHPGIERLGRFYYWPLCFNSRPKGIRGPIGIKSKSKSFS